MRGYVSAFHRFERGKLVRFKAFRILSERSGDVLRQIVPIVTIGPARCRFVEGVHRCRSTLLT